VKVSDILASKGSTIVCVKPDATVSELSGVLREQRIGAAVVSRDGQALDGVISERDIAYGLSIHNAELHALPVSALMTRTVITCHIDDDVALVSSTMLSRRVRHLPVMDGERLVGMVSMRDVLGLRVDELQQQTAMLRQAIWKPQVPQDRE